MMARLLSLSKYLLFVFGFVSPPASAAQTQPGISYWHHDWELACDNTRTCRAAGYHSDSDDLPVSILLVRRAGPHELTKGQLMLGQGENPAVDRLPPEFKLSLVIDGRSVGRVVVSKSSLVGELTGRQVSAVLGALVRRSSRIELRRKDVAWRLSDKGAAAVLLKMDEFQGRVGTSGAIVRKGKKDESSVLPPLPVPVVKAAPIPKPLGDEERFVKENARSLLTALSASLGNDNEDYCPTLTETDGSLPELMAVRLNDFKMLVSAECWRGAYNVGTGYWVVSTSPPYKAVLVTTSGSDYQDGEIFASHKGRGLGDCWTSESWTWDGLRFVRTDASSTGMCKLMAPGGAWMLPTVVTDVRAGAPAGTNKK